MKEMRVLVYKNEAGSKARGVTVKTSDSLATLKAACGAKVNVRAKMLFLESGAEVTSMDEVKNNVTLYVSAGEVFFRAAAATTTTGHEFMQVSVLGSGGVGKSALTLRFVRDYYMSDWDPTIEDAYRKTLEVDNRLAMLEILDTAGQDDFESLRAQWMTDRDAYVLVYSMDSRSSLHQLQPFFQLYQQINEYKRPMPPIVLVANKRDVVEDDPRRLQVTREEGHRVAVAFKAHYVETSALTGKNVTAIFEQIVRKVRQQKLRRPPRKKRLTVCTIL
ncbi:hypothetical protein DYB32_001406 [Aphanomyces invadans]|uniref:KHA domain-containing protein n=1 Tax=Aphanomyces invadans TaxID=157072 RepID=A0A3R6Z499_9STRA|nr:hypothetical protein DYB32_001406 [Aphanomyces invadans]